MPLVKRVQGLEPAEFASRFEQLDEPVILEGAALHWLATERWSPGYLEELLGGVEVRYKLSSTRAHPNFHEPTLAKMFARGSGTFAEFLRLITTGPREERARRLFTGDEQFLLQRRDGRTTIHEALAPLLDDAPRPEIVPEDRLYTVWAWFSGPGVRTWLHYDNNGCHNINAQIAGEKRFQLFPPSELSRMFPYPLGGANPAYNCSQVDVDAVDLERFSSFRDAACLEGRLVAGDLLFIPALWFHTFLHEGDFNANVNFWWKPLQPRLSPVAVRQALLDLVAREGVDLGGQTTAGALLRLLDERATRGT